MTFVGDNLEMLVDLPDRDCWPWKGPLTSKGYPGRKWFHGQWIAPARMLYETLVGPVSPDLTLDHLCHTADSECRGGPTCLHRRCVNPSHLEPVSLSENSMRKGKSWRGSSFAAINARKTHCPKGHEYTSENTLHRGGKFPGRICRTCHNDWNRAHPKPRRVYEPRQCVVCGEEFTPKRSDRVLCGSRRCKRIHGKRPTHL